MLKATFLFDRHLKVTSSLLLFTCLIGLLSGGCRVQAQEAPPAAEGAAGGEAGGSEGGGGGSCLCNVRFVGEYCGMTLNERNGGNGNCTNNMYFCGKSNLHAEGVILKSCVQRGFECDKKLNGGNACYQNVKCLCGPTLARKRKYCGNDLTGPDCQPNIVYRCPMIRRYNPSPEDACPNGCQDGRCL